MHIIHFLQQVILEDAFTVGGHFLEFTTNCQARIQGVGDGAGAHPWRGVSPLKMHDSIAFMHQSIIGRPPLGEILHPPLIAYTCECSSKILGSSQQSFRQEHICLVGVNASAAGGV